MSTQLSKSTRPKLYLKCCLNNDHSPRVVVTVVGAGVVGAGVVGAGVVGAGVVGAGVVSAGVVGAEVVCAGVVVVKYLRLQNAI